MFKRLEAYLNPVFWLLTDDKVMTFYSTKLSKLMRIYKLQGKIKVTNPIKSEKKEKIVPKISFFLRL